MDGSNSPAVYEQIFGRDPPFRCGSAGSRSQPPALRALRALREARYGRAIEVKHLISAPSVVGYGQEHALKTAEQHLSATEDPTWLVAVRAAESKKATDIRVLDLTGITSFADHFVICTGANARQGQAIADEVGIQLKNHGANPLSIEGYTQADWILADYGDLLIHIFSPQARAYYDLERLWRNAKSIAIPPE